MTRYIYRNNSLETKRYATASGTWKVVVPGDIFESDIPQKCNSFEDITQIYIEEFEQTKPKKKKYKRKIKQND